MSTTREDLEYHYTNDWTASFTAEDYDGNAIDVTGATLRFRLATIAGTTVFTLTESDGLTIASASDGLVTLRVTPAHQTNAGVTASTRYLWEYRVTTSGGEVLTQAHGHLNVLPSLLSS
jgi:hypothetical protein